MIVDFIVELQVLRRAAEPDAPWVVESSTELYREPVDLSAPDVITHITTVVANYSRLAHDVPVQFLDILGIEISVRVNLNSVSQQ